MGLELRGKDVFRDIDLAGDGGEILRERVVELGGEPGALLQTLGGGIAGDFLAVEFAALAGDQAVKDAVPDENGD